VNLKHQIKRLLQPCLELAMRVWTHHHGVRTTVNGTPFRVDWRNRLDFLPVYDIGATQLLDSHLKPGQEAWNVGAHVGVHVLQLCARVGPHGHVIAFEPNPHAAALLKRNIAVNQFSERVTVIQAAVGERAGTTDFFVADANPMSRPERPNPLLKKTRSITVPVVTLDEWFARRNRAPDCLFLDIEGWEIGALLSAQRLLSATPLCIVELHPEAWAWSGHTRNQLEAMMLTLDLEAIPLSGQTDPLAQLGQVWLRRRHA
jgi:FkbM family methyltransferase